MTAEAERRSLGRHFDVVDQEATLIPPSAEPSGSVVPEFHHGLGVFDVAPGLAADAVRELRQPADGQADGQIELKQTIEIQTAVERAPPRF